jgi:hypothetical protein
MRTALLSALVLLLGALGAFLSGRGSMRQTENDVYRRFSGGRLRPWLSLDKAVALHWPYAWASVAAYQDSDDPKRKPLEITAECPEPHAFLSTSGWTLWEELPSLKTRGDTQTASYEMRRVHLRAEVWSSETDRQIVVAFGGTAAASLQDWKSNLRWLLAPFHPHDAYEVLTNTFVPAFVNAYLTRSAEPGNVWMKTAQVVATGHSLGGGLAERFAYSLNHEPGVPRVREVYTFDPSPVSGKRGVKDWEQQAHGLTIYRIYNRGEILASVRSIFALAEDPPEKQGQSWIDIRYRDHWSWRTLLPSGSVHAHGMYELACFMKEHLHPTAYAQPEPGGHDDD